VNSTQTEAAKAKHCGLLKQLEGGLATHNRRNKIRFLVEDTHGAWFIDIGCVRQN